MLLPRHLEIIYEINRRFLDHVRRRFPGDEDRVERMSLIEEGAERKVRMANLAIVGSHSTNGVAAIHSELLRTIDGQGFRRDVPRALQQQDQRRHAAALAAAGNPALAGVITEAIGDGWITDLAELAKLKPLADDARLPRRGPQGQARRQGAVCRLAQVERRRRRSIRTRSSTARSSASTNTSGSCSTRCASSCCTTGCARTPSSTSPPRTFFFAGKAAPAYHLAKLIIKFINNLAGTIDGDPAVRGRLKVVFLPDYYVSLAERLIPASDVSNQISTAGYEASGTSNMKFMMNGALTIGTRDGATIEMAEEAGEENFFLFGLTAEQVADSRGWYNPRWHYENEPETRAALDLIFSDHFSRNEPGIFEPLRDTLLTARRPLHAPGRPDRLSRSRPAPCELYADPRGWARKAILNVAGSGQVLQRPHDRRIRRRNLERRSPARLRRRFPVGARPTRRTRSRRKRSEQSWR